MLAARRVYPDAPNHKLGTLEPVSTFSGEVPAGDNAPFPVGSVAARHNNTFPMIRLIKTLNAWGSSGFEDILKAEVEQLDTDQLPLQQCLSTTSYVTDSPRKMLIISVADEEWLIRVKAGIFYSGIIAGCSCADDPTPVEEQNEYCEVQLEINKKTAEATVVLLMK